MNFDEFDNDTLAQMYIFRHHIITDLYERLYSLQDEKDEIFKVAMQRMSGAQFDALVAKAWKVLAL